MVVALGQNTVHVLLDARTQLPLLLPEAVSSAQRVSSVVHAERWLAKNLNFTATCFLAAELTAKRLRTVACVLGALPPKLVLVREIKSLTAGSPGDDEAALRRWDHSAQPSHEELLWASPATLASHSAAALCAAACIKAASFACPDFAPRASLAVLFGDIGWKGTGTVGPSRVDFEFRLPEPPSLEWTATMDNMHVQTKNLRRVFEARASANNDIHMLAWLDRIKEPDPASVPKSLRGEPSDTAAHTAASLPFSFPYKTVTSKRIATSPQPLPPEGFNPRSLRDLLFPWAFDAVTVWLEKQRADLLSYLRDPTSPRRLSHTLAIGQDGFVPDARGIVWDLRQEGVAEPLDFQAAVDSRRDAQGRLGLNAAWLAGQLEGYEDQELAGHLFDGVNFKTELALQIVLTPHLVSMAPFVAGTNSELERLASLGYFVRHDSLPFAPCRATGCGSVPKKRSTNRRRTSDHGAPRKKTLDTEGLPVVALNDACDESTSPRFATLMFDPTHRGTPNWPKEVKPKIAHIAHDGAILAGAARAFGEPLYTFTIDFADYFNQFPVSSECLWMCNMVWLASLNSEAQVEIINERTLGFGARPASNIGQRFAWALISIFKRFFAIEEATLLDSITDPRRVGTSAAAERRRWREQRRLVGVDSGNSSESDLFAASMYTDDVICLTVGAERTYRALRTWHVITTKARLRTAPLCKLELGVFVTYLGFVIHAALRAAYVTEEKRLRALLTLETVAAGGVVDAGTLKALLGLLEHIASFSNANRGAFYGLYEPLRNTDPNSRVRLGSLGQRSAAAWVQRLRESPGRHWGVPIPRLPASFDCHLYLDACKGDAAHPHLGMFMYGVRARFELSPQDLLLPIAILEFAAVGVACIIFSKLLRLAASILLVSDSLFTAQTVAAWRARTPQTQRCHDVLASTPEFAELVTRLSITHTYGDSNPFADLESRDKLVEMEKLACQHGLTLTRLDATPAAGDFMLRLRDAYKGAAFSGCMAGDGPPSSMEKLARQHSLSPTHFDATSAENDLLLRLRDAFKGAAFSGCMDGDGPLLASAPPRRREASPLPCRAPTASLSPTQRPHRRRSPSVERRLVCPRTQSPRRQHRRSPSAERRHDRPRAQSPRRSHRAVPSDRGFLALGGTSSGTRHTAPPPPPAAIFNTGRSPNQQSGLVVALLNDTSPYALRPTDPAILASDCAAIDHLVALGPAQSTRRRDLGAPWTRWLTHCAARQTEPWRFDVAANSGIDLLGQRRESILMATFLIAVAFEIKPRSSTNSGAKPQSIMANLDAVKRLHKDKGFPMAPSSLAGQVLKGMTRRYVEKYGQEALLPSRKEPFSRREVTELLSLPNGTRLGNFRLNWSSPGGVALQALLQTEAQSGFRKDEVSSNEHSHFDLSRDHLSFIIGHIVVRNPSTAQLQGMSTGDFVIIRASSSKCDPFAQFWGNNPLYFPFKLTAPINAARALRDLAVARPINDNLRVSTPLFADDAGRPFSASFLDSFLKHAMHIIAPARAPLLSWHSWRIYVACTLRASGADDGMIQALLRWKSASSLHIYARLNPEVYGSWLSRAANADTTSVQTTSLPVLSPDGVVATLGPLAQLAALNSE